MNLESHYPEQSFARKEIIAKREAFITEAQAFLDGKPYESGLHERKELPEVDTEELAQQIGELIKDSPTAVIDRDKTWTVFFAINQYFPHVEDAVSLALARSNDESSAYVAEIGLLARQDKTTLEKAWVIRRDSENTLQLIALDNPDADEGEISEKGPQLYQLLRDCAEVRTGKG